MAPKISDIGLEGLGCCVAMLNLRFYQRRERGNPPV